MFMNALVFKLYDKKLMNIGNMSVIYRNDIVVIYGIPQTIPKLVVTRITLTGLICNSCTWFVDVTNYVSLSFHFRLSVIRVGVIGEVTDSNPCDLRDNTESLVTTCHMR